MDKEFKSVALIVIGVLIAQYLANGPLSSVLSSSS